MASLTAVSVSTKIKGTAVVMGVSEEMIGITCGWQKKENIVVVKTDN